MTITIAHPDPLRLLENLTPLAPKGVSVGCNGLTFSVDLAGSDDLPAVERVARRVAIRVMREGSMGRRGVSHFLASRDRHLMDDAIAFAVSAGWIREVPFGWVGVQHP